MVRQVNYIELVERAQRGDKESLNELAAIAKGRLHVYVYRLTLNDDLTQEIVQESLFEMCRVLDKLRKTDRFWSWLYGIATNKLHRHYRTERALKKAAAAEERRRGPMKARQGGLENLVGEELKQIVSGAMQKLRTRHKAVLVMRCYDEMSYAEIAESMGCSEFGTRMLFMRAKRALQKELSRNGFGKGSLLAALIVFGKITAPSKAAAAELTVPIAATKVGVLAGVASLATTKTAILSMTAAGALTVGTIVTTSGPAGDGLDVGGPRAATTAAVSSPLAAVNSQAGGYYYYFPDGPQGSVMLRAESKGRAGRPGERVLQNQATNYSYQGDTVHKTNYRAWNEDLSVFRLPTDSRQLRAFLAQMDGTDGGPEPIAASGRRLLVVAERDAQTSGPSRPWAVQHRNVLDEEYFQSDWPTGTKIDDLRDAMHTRGWTYFRVRGTLDGKKVTGTGRVPFVYAEARRHNAWLKLRLADELTIVDSDAGTLLSNAEGKVVAKYRRGSFLQGLARPWMGLHAVDTVRRDAAAMEIPFETALTADGRGVRVTVSHESTILEYTIDLESDLIENIAFSVDGRPVGNLEFEYLQDVDAAAGRFRAPQDRAPAGRTSGSPGILWLVRLANGTLID